MSGGPKRLLLAMTAAVGLLCTPAHAGEWRKLAGDDEASYHMWTAVGNLARYRLAYTYVSMHRGRYEVQKFEVVECSKTEDRMTIRTVASRERRQYNNKWELVDEEADFVVPGSWGEALYKAVCALQSFSDFRQLTDKMGGSWFPMSHFAKLSPFRVGIYSNDSTTEAWVLSCDDYATKVITRAVRVTQSEWGPLRAIDEKWTRDESKRTYVYNACTTDP